MNKLGIAVGVAITALGCAAPAQADTVFGVYVGGQYWDTETSGSFGTSTDQQRFNFADDGQKSYYIAVEHPVPFVPNVKIKRNDLATDGFAVLSQNYEFNGQTYTQNTRLDGLVDLTHTDYIFYYEIFDNDLVSLDLGLNAKDVDGYLQVSAEGVRNQVDASSWVPTAYGQLRLGIPGTAFTLYGGGSFLAIDDSNLRDVEAGVEYRVIDSLAVNLNLQLGYRDLNIELDDIDDIYTDIQFKGPYFGIELHF